MLSSPDGFLPGFMESACRVASAITVSPIFGPRSSGLVALISAVFSHMYCSVCLSYGRAPLLSRGCPPILFPWLPPVLSFCTALVSRQVSGAWKGQPSSPSRDRDQRGPFFSSSDGRSQYRGRLSNHSPDYSSVAYDFSCSASVRVASP